MQFDPSAQLDLSQISIGKPYHGPVAHNYTELMNWNANHASNGMDARLCLIFIAVFCLVFCLFGIYDLYRKGEVKCVSGNHLKEWQTIC